MRLELDNDQLDIFRDAFWAGDELDEERFPRIILS
jgi:hypothetical protein